MLGVLFCLSFRFGEKPKVARRKKVNTPAGKSVALEDFADRSSAESDANDEDEPSAVTSDANDEVESSADESSTRDSTFSESSNENIENPDDGAPESNTFADPATLPGKNRTS